MPESSHTLAQLICPAPLGAQTVHNASMPDKPVVCVVMPAFNPAAHIGETIKSILGQTVQDFELLVVDDDSTDETPHIGELYGLAHPPAPR
jgi:cellulose synthase/poly-beta-1,6-N-acetylglucosamine synthase-like glycosyltransferase